MAATAGEGLDSRWSLSGLDELLQRLRRAGLRIGTSETIDAVRLIRALAQQRPELTDDRTLKASLRAALCKSAQQQRQFDPVFDQWQEERLHVEYRPRESARAPAAVAQAPAPVEPERHMRWLRFLLAVAVVLALATGTWWWLRPPPAVTSTPPVVQPDPSASSPSSVRPVAPLPEDADAIRVYGYFPLVRYHAELRPLWLWLALGLPVLLLLGVDAPARWLRGGQSRNAGREVRLQGWSSQDMQARTVLPLRADTGGRLLRHLAGPASELRRLERRPQLHVRRTVEATFRNLGIPALRFRDARLIPSYLVLVEADRDDDLAMHWARRLVRARIDVDLRRIVMRDGEPHVLRPRAGTHDTDPLKALPNPPFGQRLIVISEGAWMADAKGQLSDAAGAARFARWPRRVFFTPREPRRWGRREDGIEKPERMGDPGFLLLPIDENALDAWSRLLVSNKLPDIELESPQHFPRLVHVLGEDALLADTPPEGELGTLIAQLKRYLGPNGFFWLCCCAVPPLLHPGLTLLLGEAFLRNSGAGDDDLTYLVARNYRLLLRLPWIRRSCMPQWLRVVLLASLSPAIQDEVRKAVSERLAEQNPDAEGSLTLRLDFERPPAAATGASSGAGASGDLLYLGFLAGLTPQQLALRIPGEWKRWIDALQPRRSGWQGLLDRLAAVWDRMRYVRGMKLLGPRRWSGGVAVLWLAVVAFAAAWLGNQQVAPQGHATWLDWFVQERASRVQMRHEDWVRGAAFSPDGTRVVTVSRDRTARVWDAASGAAVGAPMRHEGWVWSAAFSPDGTRVVTASADRTARVWDAASGAMVGAPMRHEDEVYSATFSPNGTRVVTASADRTARVWNAASGAAVSAPMPHMDWVVTAAFSPDGTRVATASGDRTARVWDVASGAAVGAPMRHERGVYTAAFSPDGTRVVTASLDHTARVWDAASGAAVGAPLRHEDQVRSAAFSPDGTRVATASDDRTARVWDAASGAAVGAPLRHEDALRSAAFSPDGTRVATASLDGTARVWDAASGAAVGAPMRHEGEVYTATFSPDGRRVLTASDDRTARVWDAASGAAVGMPMRHEERVRSAAFSPDGTRVLTVSGNRTVRVWDAASGAAVGAPMPHEYGVYTAAFSPDGTRVVTASADGTARVWDAASSTAVGAPMRHEDAVWSAAFSPDGTRVVTASADRTARVWDAASGAAVGSPLRHEDWVNTAAFSPDGTRVVTASVDGTVREWDAASGAAVGAPMRHEARVSSTTFSPDGTRVATASADRTARVWDAASGAAVGTPMRHEETVRSAAFSPDGTRVVTASDDGTARVWDAATASLMAVTQVHGPVPNAQFSREGDRIVIAVGSQATPIGAKALPEGGSAPDGVAVQPSTAAPAAPNAGGPRRWPGNAAYVVRAPQPDAVLDQSAGTTMERARSAVQPWAGLGLPGLTVLAAVAAAALRQRRRFSSGRGDEAGP